MGTFASGPDNIDRAAWARRAANVFAKDTFCGRSFDNLVIDQPDEGDDAYCVLQDLITNLCHLARQYGWEAEKLVERGLGNFNDEVDEADAD